MSSGWFTPRELRALRRAAEVGLISDVEIYRQTRITNESDPENIYEDGGISFVYSETVRGWMYSSPTSSPDSVRGVIGTMNTYRLFLPVGTQIEPGDRVKVNGTEYEFIDAVDESTWLPILRCSLRRLV